VIARGAFYIMLARVAFVLSGYALHVSMAHLLAPADYGSLGVVLGLITLWRVFLSAGVPQTTTRFIAASPGQAWGTWRKALTVQAAGALALWALYAASTPFWMWLLNDDSLAPYILLSSFLIPLMAWYQVNLAFYAGRMQFGVQASLISLYSISRVALAVPLVIAGLALYGVVLGITVAALLVASLSHAGIRKEPPGASSTPNWREMVAFSLPLIAVSFGISALLNLDLLLLKHFYPVSDIVGYYSGAVNLGKAPYWILSAFATTALPSVAGALGGRSRKGARQMVQRHVSYVLLISLPAAALIVPSAGRLLELVYPEPYAAAAVALALLVCSGSALAVLTVLTSALTAAGRPRTSMAIVLGCTALQIVAGVALVPRYAMLGAAAANLVTVVSGVTAAGWLVHARFGGVVEIGRVLKSAGLSFLLGMPLWLWSGYPSLALPVIYTAGIFFYVRGMLALGAFTSSELESLRRVFRRGASGEADTGPRT
jgi:O-antigen/teichoic acid export membrane protein